MPPLRNTPRAFLMMFRMPRIKPVANGRAGKMNRSGYPALRNKERSTDKVVSEFSQAEWGGSRSKLLLLGWLSQGLWPVTGRSSWTLTRYSPCSNASTPCDQKCNRCSGKPWHMAWLGLLYFAWQLWCSVLYTLQTGKGYRRAAHLGFSN